MHARSAYRNRLHGAVSVHLLMAVTCHVTHDLGNHRILEVFGYPPRAQSRQIRQRRRPATAQRGRDRTRRGRPAANTGRMRRHSQMMFRVVYWCTYLCCTHCRQSCRSSARLLVAFMQSAVKHRTTDIYACLPPLFHTCYPGHMRSIHSPPPIVHIHFLGSVPPRGSLPLYYAKENPTGTEFTHPFPQS